MIRRCTDPGVKSFPHYGARGIKVCDRWSGPDGFANFIADMGPRPAGTSIDRVDVDGHYEPSNCRWATPTTQSRNRRFTLGEDAVRDIRRRIDAGEKQIAVARLYGVSRYAIRNVSLRVTWKDAA